MSDDFFDELDASLNSDKESEIKKLREELRASSQKYYSTGKSDLTDKEWDNKYYRLAELCPDDPILSEVGHGYDVDEELNSSDDGVKFVHPIIAGSIPKTKDIELIKRKIGKKSKWSVKLDGNAMFCYYRKGVLENAATRGKNNIGIDKTHKMKLIIPNLIPVDREYFVVKGEVVILKKDYTVANGFDVSKSSRNTVAGILNKKEGWESQMRFLVFIAYIFEDINTKKTIEDNYSWDSWYKVEKQKDCKIFLETPIEEFYETYKLDWECDSDGTVFRFDDMSMLALKYEEESGDTEGLNNELTIGSDQRLTPVANLRPINLCGSTVRRASFGSFNKLQKLGLWPTPHEYRLTIIKANEIIPKVIGAKIIVPHDQNQPITYPICPSCGQESQPKGKHVFCVNNSCPNIEESRLYKFAGFFYPKGLSDSKAEKLFKYHNIVTVVDLLKFNYKKYDYTKIPGIGKSDNVLIMMFFDNLSGRIDSKIVYQSLLISCGRSYSKAIVKSGFAISDVWTQDGKYPVLQEIDGISSNLLTELATKRTLIKEVCELREVYDDVPQNVVGSFCITNARFSPEQLSRLKLLGWVEDDTVKKTTTVLITNDIDNITGKVEKARKYKIPVVEIPQFFEEFLGEDQ